MNQRIIVLALVVTAVGCKSDEERCDEAQTAAQQAWTSYVEVTVARKPLVATRLANAHLAMRRMTTALSAAATEETNKLYDRGSAWQRHYEVALTQACRRDPACAAIETERDQAKADADTIDERIGLARHASKIATGEPEAAWAAAKAIEAEKNVPASVAAELAAKAAADTCGVDRGP